jgi:hypothetical protein
MPTNRVALDWHSRNRRRRHATIEQRERELSRRIVRVDHHPLCRKRIRQRANDRQSIAAWRYPRRDGSSCYDNGNRKDEKCAIGLGTTARAGDQPAHTRRQRAVRRTEHLTSLLELHQCAREHKRVTRSRY